MLTPSVKALFKHPIKIPIKYSDCAGNLGAPVGIDSCHGQKGRLARRFHVLASEIVGLCNTGLWPHPPTCPLSFARRQLSSRPCKAKTRRFDSRFRNRARDCAERALGCNDSKVAATRHPRCFDRSCGLWTRLSTITASTRASHLELVRPVVAYQVRQRRRRC